MRLKIPSAVKAIAVLTAAGLLLGGCYYHPRANYGGPYYGGPHYAAPGHGHYKHHGHHGHGKHRKHGDGHYRWRHGGRGWR